MSGRILPFTTRPAKALRAQGEEGSGEGGSGPESSRRPRSGGPSGTAAPGFSPSQASRFRNLILPHLPSAYSLARYLAGDPAAAEDIAQDAMLKAWRHFTGFRGESPKAWLMAIVRNAHLDWTRKNRPWRSLAAAGLDEESLAAVADPDQADPESLLAAKGDATRLQAAIQALSEPFREALVLRNVEKLSYRQIADITGVAIGTVMSRLARARAILGRELGFAEEAR
ncbi:MAG: sigma-70 family RNA polymerase sigma factor [Caulobacteraceae bacterium]